MLTINSLQTTYNVTLMYAIVWTINSHYASNSSKPLTIAQFSTRESTRGLHNDIIDAALGLASSAGRIKFLLEDERLKCNDTTPADEQNGKPHPSGNITRDTGMWFLDSLRAFRRLEQAFLHPGSLYRRNGYYCIIYTGQDRDRLAIIREIFRRLLDIYVINVNVFLTQNDTGAIHVYTYYPYQSHRCQSPEPVHYATFEGVIGAQPLIQINNSGVFFDFKMDNMYGCKMVTATFDYPPYIIIKDDPDVPGGRRLLGIEGMLYSVLAERMNFTIELMEFPTHDRGIICSNGTTTGIMRLLVEGSANITIGAYVVSRSRAKYIQPSMTYMSFPIVLCVPGGRQLTPLERLTKPLGCITWMCIILSVLLGFGVIGALEVVGIRQLNHFVLGVRNRTPCCDLWNILFGGMHSNPPKRNFARYLLALWLLKTLVLRTAYTGELYIILQDGSARSPVRTLDEVIQQQYWIHLAPTMATVFSKLIPDKKFLIVSDLTPSLKRLQDDEMADIAVPVLQPTVGRFNIESGPEKPRLTVLPDPVLTAQLVLYMRPHSYFWERINYLLINIMSGGLLNRFIRIYLDRIEHMNANRKHEPTMLNLWLLSGIFISMAIMELLALIVFLLELRATSPHRLRLRRFIDAANRFVA